MRKQKSTNMSLLTQTEGKRDRWIQRKRAKADKLQFIQVN